MQFGLFGEPESIEVINLDGEVIYYPNFFTDDFFEELRKEINWRQDKITLYGKTHDIPRLQAWYGDGEKDYSYSGVKLQNNNFNQVLNIIREKISTGVGLEFNSCLCNLYRDGRDYAAWHSDDEKELGVNPIIASASFGETRKFIFKHKTNKGVEKVELNVEDKSLIIMKGKLQHCWKHQISKTAKKVGQRINLTFRTIK
ncbi:alpha-ketoglutarate-dependent dioxygenase AlkB [Bacteriovorax sp. Seq25_V]|uniref:alpha-ketoglutarate-dependent dioxygenase AlkB family protein n=1 Tax=Bacteriovorax sp. Seq25_V TaxID=1201288 RepID=UPI00038A136C|nr:alpha-ketoglutarate-dependent dioxygenase AlkB [Bacteriovorax sp. Seq25_V]EQC44051.1 2OG-Fe(II) oxygenase family protein [Bacteriovorax sp. Seq25_V]